MEVADAEAWWAAPAGQPSTAAGDAAPPLRSFWMGGFEGADHRNARGAGLDMVAASAHDVQLQADYARCARFGLRTVRESIGWRLAEIAPGRHDLTRLHRMQHAAAREGVQVLWTLMHYGMPDDLHVMHADFVPRFVDYAVAVARALRDGGDPAPIVTPVNEIGFLAWVLSETRQMAGAPPDAVAVAGDSSEATTLRSGYELKARLVQASIAAMRAMRELCPGIRFLHIEPLVHVVAPRDVPELEATAIEVASYQWQAWDLIAGRLDPELGGAPEWLDLIGVNHYHSGQWEAGTERRLSWERGDPRRVPLGDLLLDCWRRYRRPMLIAETGHFGRLRARWLHEVAAEAARVRALGVPLHGVCLYPIVDRHGWDDPAHWHHSGLWDAAEATPAMRRLARRYARALQRWQRRFESTPALRTEPSGITCHDAAVDRLLAPALGLRVPASPAPAVAHRAPPPRDLHRGAGA